MVASAFRDRLLKAIEKRRFPRVADRPIFVIVDNKLHRATDWSLGGFQIRDLKRPVGIGEKISGELRASDGRTADASFVAEVMWRSGGHIGCRFLAIGDLQEALEGVSEPSEADDKA